MKGPVFGLLVGVVAAGCLPALARAQTPDPVETARIQWGPLGLTPSGALTNVGVDTNVFNEVDNPQRDFTLTVSPQVAGWFRAGRSMTAFTARTDLVYFRRFASERSVDGAFEGRFEYPMIRLRPWVEAAVANGKQRIGYEIDLRVRRRTTEIGFGADVHLGTRTDLALFVRRANHDFDGDADFFGSNLRETLQRRTETAGLEYRYRATVYTALIVEAQVLRDRFELSPLRDADSGRVVAGLDLDARALIGGEVRVGYRRLRGIGGSVPEYAGAVTAFSTGITVGNTRLEFAGNRDIDYSFERSYPYYVITGGTLTATPRLTRAWDIQARAGGQRLDYRPGVGAQIPDRLDRHTAFGVGVGYHLGETARVGLNVDKQKRRSPVERRDYDGYRIWTSVTYGQ